jgi:hypothetical protein
MHVAHHYALNCGAQLSPPHIPSAFYPVPLEKYICICTRSEVTSKKYDFYPEVISLLQEHLLTEDIQIIHISDTNDPPLSHTTNYGALTKKQYNYILSNASLVISNDHYYSHAASALGKKVVSLFGPLYKDISKPLWGAGQDQSFIESNRNNKKPSFTGEEGESKSINLITPEQIASETLRLLKIENEIGNIKTLSMGKYYAAPVVEVIPDFMPENKLYEGSAINLRLDLHFDDSMIAKWAFNRKLNVVSNQILPRASLDIVRPHIVQVMLEVNDEMAVDDLSLLSSGGYNLFLFTKDESKVKDLRLKFIDWDINLITPSSKKDLDNHDKICDNTYFKSSKTMTSKNKHYSSIASWRQGVEKSDKEPVIDDPEFWTELDYFRIYNQ